MTIETRQLIENYYAAFNAGDMDRFLGLLDDNVVHVINEGTQEIGREAFATFMQRMNDCYRERIDSLIVFSDDSGTRAAAEFVVHGTYLKTDTGLPEARNQTYQLAAGAFFEVRDGKVARITNYYSLSDWLKQVQG
jgi:steroid delta-isomerase-like uncharacterized protein